MTDNQIISNTDLALGVTVPGRKFCPGPKL